MKWPAHKVEKADKQDRRTLGVWLAEWDLDRRLMAADADPGPMDAMSTAVPGTYERDALREGDIRLLMPVRSGEMSEFPLYVALLPGATEDTLWWVPFGRFATPALPSEWSTGMKHRALRVLCFWNARCVETKEAPGSWRVKRLTERQRADIASVYRALESGDSLPGRLRKRVGPPLVHPADPRHEYQAEERDRMALHFIDRAMHSGSEEEGGLYLSEWSTDPVAWLMAAEVREKYGVAAAIYITEDDAVILVVYTQSPERVRIRIMNRDGFPCTQYDGGYVESESGEVSGRIEKGSATVPSHVTKQLRVLVDQHGTRTLLQRKDRETPK